MYSGMIPVILQKLFLLNKRRDMTQRRISESFGRNHRYMRTDTYISHENDSTLCPRKYRWSLWDPFSTFMVHSISSFIIDYIEQLDYIHDADQMAPADQRALGAGSGRIGPSGRMQALSSGYYWC